MCGIFGIIVSPAKEITFDIAKLTVNCLFRLSESRGSDSSGLSVLAGDMIQVYKKAEKATDFLIKNTKFRNANCYEATKEEIYADLNNTKYMIAISNNAWFTPSIQPTLQKLLLKYYAKKYNITIFHSVNGSSNYIINP